MNFDRKTEGKPIFLTEKQEMGNLFYGKGRIFMKEKGKSKVILADRDGFYLQRLKRCLERKGDMQVLGMTDSGPALLGMAKDLQPDVILMDILLGDRDGFWVLENLKKEGIACICIMISAIDSDKMVRQAITLGAEYYMAKPIQGDCCWNGSISLWIMKQFISQKQAGKKRSWKKIRFGIWRGKSLYF